MRLREKPAGPAARVKIRFSWLITLFAAIAGAIYGAEAVTHAHQKGLAATLADWAVHHGLVSAASAQDYESALDFNIHRLLPGLAISVLFSLYWVVASKNRADDVAPEAPASSSLHQLLAGVSLLLICLPMPGLTQRLLPSSALMLWVGLSLELGGVVLAVAARRALGRNWSREVRLAVGHELVRSGPYRHLRHPIYTGALCISLGLAIASGLVSAFAGLALLILAYIRKIALEERLLADAFGPAFQQYRSTSWALIPFLV